MTNEEKVLFELDVDRRIRAGVPAHHAHQAAQAQQEQNRRAQGPSTPQATPTSTSVSSVIPAPPTPTTTDLTDRLNALHDQHAALREEVTQLRDQLQALATGKPVPTPIPKKAKR